MLSPAEFIARAFSRLTNGWTFKSTKITSTICHSFVFLCLLFILRYKVVSRSQLFLYPCSFVLKTRLLQWLLLRYNWCSVILLFTDQNNVMDMSVQESNEIFKVLILHHEKVKILKSWKIACCPFSTDTKSYLCKRLSDHQLKLLEVSVPLLTALIILSLLNLKSPPAFNILWVVLNIFAPLMCTSMYCF